MTTDAATGTDTRTCERLSRRFADMFSTLQGDDVIAPDAFFDLNMPVWRFQLQGAQAFVEQLRAINEGPSHVQVLRTVPTASGFVAEHEEYQAVGDAVHMARRLWLCEVRGEQIVEATGFCTGDWDDALRARHRREAPMLRPWPTAAATTLIPDDGGVS